MVEGGSDPGMGPVQSVGVLTVGGVTASAGDKGWALPGEGGVPGPHCDRSASILCTCGVPSHLVG